MKKLLAIILIALSTNVLAATPIVQPKAYYRIDVPSQKYVYVLEWTPAGNLNMRCIMIINSNKNIVCYNTDTGK